MKRQNLGRFFNFIKGIFRHFQLRPKLALRLRSGRMLSLSKQSVVEPLKKADNIPANIEKPVHPVDNVTADIGKLTQSGAEIAKVNNGIKVASTPVAIPAPGDGLNAGSNVGKGAARCPFCSGKNIIKRGKREKKYEVQQRYLCNDCHRSFVPQMVKGKSFPLKLILEGLSHYNTGFTMVETCTYLKEKFGMEVKDSTLSDWTKEFEPICRYSRLRPYGLKLFSPNQVIQTVHLYHHQVYDFSVHRGKLALLLQEYKYGKFDNLREFLEAIQSECPHQFFQEGLRASELKVDFSLDEVIIREKQNFANRIAQLVLQAVSDNKLRHKALQDFMLANDSVTVAAEVPVYMDGMDIEHMQEELKFRIPLKLDKVLTGHIDILQLRNGAVHILDYKPQADKGKRSVAVTQLTLYALMLSRLTGLRLYDFKCAWFDENAYYEFFPLHVVYKLRQRAKKESPEQIKFEEITNNQISITK